MIFVWRFGGERYGSPMGRRRRWRDDTLGGMFGIKVNRGVKVEDIGIDSFSDF